MPEQKNEDCKQVQFNGELKKENKIFLLLKHYIMFLIVTLLMASLPATAAQVPRFAYVANISSNTVTGYKVDSATGALWQSGTVSTGSSPKSVAVDPSGRFAYVANYSSVSVYSIDQTNGTLTAGTEMPTGSGVYPISVTVDASGRFLYVISNQYIYSSSNYWQISAYSIDQATGVLTAVNSSSFYSSTTPTASFDPTGRFIYTSWVNGSSTGRYIYSINRNSSAVALTSSESTTAAITSGTVDPTGRFFYATYSTYNNVYPYAIDQTTGALTSIGSSVLAGSSPRSITIDPSGKWAYVANYNSNSISVYSVDQTTGALTSIGTTATGSSPQSVTVDPTGQYAYVINSGASTIGRYRINQASGALTWISTIPSTIDNSALAMAVTQGSSGFNAVPNYSYSANFGSNNISTFGVNPSTGALAAGTLTAAGEKPTVITVDPSGRFAYRLNWLQNMVTSHTIDQASGAMTETGTTATGFTPTDIVTDFIGSKAYVTNYSANTVAAYTVNQTTGLLTASGTAKATGSLPVAVATHPNGLFIYVVNNGSNNVSVFKDGSTLTPVMTAQTGATPTALSLDPTGRFAYVANQGSNSISAYSISQITGALSSIGTVATGTAPVFVAVDPSGRFVYVANRDSNDLSIYSINPAIGTLTAVATVAAGTTPRWVNIDATGKTLYVANWGSNDVSAYSIDQTTGNLTPNGTAAAGATPYSLSATTKLVTDTSATELGAPAWVRAVAGVGQATIMFAIPGNDGGSAITGYSVTSSPEGLTASGSSSPLTVAGLTNGTSYSFTVTVTNSVSATATSAVSNTVTPGMLDQRISFSGSYYPYVGGTFTLSAAASSTLPVSFSSLTPEICTVSGYTVTGIASGTCTIAANQAGDASYNPAPQATRDITINKTSQSISFSSLPTLTAGGTGTVSATSGSGLAVVFSSLTPDVCTVSGNTVSALIVGTCTIAADQPGNTIYSAASQNTRSITVSKASQTISFGPAPVVIMGGSGTISANVNSGLPVSLASSSPGICSVSGITVTGITVGSCTITANQAGNSTYAAATQAILTFSILRSAQTSSPKFTYVANNDSNTVSIFRVDPATGALQEAGSAVTGQEPISVAVDLTGRFAYVANYASNTVSVYTIDQATGALVAGTSLPTGTNPIAVTVDPTARFVYVANTNENSVSAYSINQTTGALTATGIAAAGTWPESLTVDPAGRFVYVVNWGSNDISTFNINQTTGALTAAGSVAGGTQPGSISIDPLGRFAYAANYTSNDLSVYSINQTSGGLTAGTSVATGTNPIAVTVDPTGQFVYVANDGSDTISVYTIDQNSGALTPGASVATGGTPQSVTVDASGKFLYVTNWLTDNLSTYSINQTSGALTAGPNMATGVSPMSLGITTGIPVPLWPTAVAVAAGYTQATVTWTSAMGATGYNLYYSTTSNISIDGEGVTKLSGVSSGTMISGLAEGTIYYFIVTTVGVTGESPLSSEVSATTLSTVSGAARFAYVANSGSNTVSIYNVTPTGQLFPLGTVATGNNPYSVTVDPSGRFAYVANFYSYTVSMYSINQASGALTSIGTVATGDYSSPNSVTVDPTGRFAYARNSNTKTVLIYSIDQSSGILTPVGSPVATGTTPDSVAIDPTGRFAYVANSTTSTVSIYSLNQASGALTSLGTVATGNSPYSVTVDPTGRFAYVANNSSNTVSVYQINQTSGALTSLGTVATGSYPQSVTVDPTGRFAYVANSSSSTVSMYSINQTNGALTSLGTVATGYNPYSVTVDSTSRFVYVANSSSSTVSLYSIDQTSGALTSLGTVATGSSPRSIAVSRGSSRPTATTMLTARAGWQSVALTWPCQYGATSYNLYYSTSPGSGTNGTKIEGAISNSAITSLTNGTPYYFVVTAVNSNGEGPLSNEVTATPLKVVPTGLTANIANNRVMLAWSSVTDASSYIIYRSTSSGGVGTQIGTSATPAYSDITALNSSTYYYTVTALFADGESAPSTEVSATPLASGSGTARFAYVVNSSSNTVSVFSVDQASGALTASSTAATESYPISIAVDPFGRFAYVANYSSNTVSMYSINQASGALTPLGTVATGNSPYAVAVDPNGRFAYVANAGSNTISIYSINQATGTLTSIGTAVATSSAPYSVTVDPTGRFAYVVNRSSSTVSMYSINQTNGALTSIGTEVATGSYPQSVKVDPTGRFAYVANNGSNTVSMYSINQTSGALTSFGTAVATGSHPQSVTADPSGRFAYVANYGSNTVSIYSINQTSGALTTIGTATTGSSPYSVTVDPSGRFAYVANGGSNTVSTYSINQESGALTSIGTAATGNYPYSVVTSAGVSNPAAPRSVTVAPGNATVLISWAYSSGATSYNIYRSTSSGVAGSLVASSTSISFTDTSVINNTTYYYMVTALNPNGESAASNEASGTPVAPLANAPADLNATADIGQITVSWSPVEGATGYNLYYRTSAGVSTSNSTKLAGVSSGRVITGLTNGTTYYLVVTALNNGGESPLSSEVSATPQLVIPAVPAGLSVQTSVTAKSVFEGGDQFSIALKNDGTVGAWGSNSSGQLGDGTTTQGLTPVQASGLNGVTAVTAGDYHSIALKNDATLWGWGNNGYGQLGDGTTTNRNIPVQVNGLSGVTSFAAGLYHTLAVKNDSTVWAWGYNTTGQLGDGTTIDHSTPVQVLSGLSGVAAVTAGYQYSIALKNDGTVWGWGYNSYGQLGDGTFTTRTTPVQVNTVSGITAIAAGGANESYTVALKNDGTVWAWGNNSYGQLGDGSTTTNRSTPVQASGLSGVTAIAAGAGHTLALKSDGTVWAWGRNSYGQLGDGSTTTRTTPVKVSGLSGVTAIVAGSSHSLALKSDGTVWGWGNNGYGQLGDGSTTSRTTPVQVSGLAGMLPTTQYNKVSWPAVVGATSYTIYWSTTPGFETANALGSSTVTATSYTHYGVNGGTVYYYRVAATDGAGSSSASAEISVETALAAPKGVTATATNGQITVSWTAATGATGYNLYYGTEPGVTTASLTKVVGAPSGSAIAGLVNGTRYYLAVTAVNGSDESPLSAEVSVLPLALPAAPTTVSATAGIGQITVNWLPVSGASSYNIYYSTTSGTGTGGIVVNNAAFGTTISSLTNGTTYYFIVTAVNAPGEGSPSAEVFATVVGVPAAPSGVGASGGDGRVTVNWQPVNYATSYNIYYGTSSGVTPTSGTKITGATITGLTNGTPYYFIVTAVNAAGESMASGAISATPNLPPVPAAPTGVNAVAGSEKVTISWTAVSSATLYNIYYGTSSGVTTATGTMVAGVASGTAVSGLTGGTAYYFIVTAVNTGGESPASGEVSATPTIPTNGAPFVYVANQGDGSALSTISVYSTDKITGALIVGTELQAGMYPTAVTVDPSGRFAYAANGGDWVNPGTISVFSINQSSGALTAGAEVPTGGIGTDSVSVDPSGRFAYAASQGDGVNPGVVSGYTVDSASGALSAVSDVQAGLYTNAVTVDPSGRFAYAANGGDGSNPGTISVYSINQSSGALTAGTEVTAGLWPMSVTVDPSGRFAYAANVSDSTISVYTINQNSGALTAGTAVAAGACPISVAVDPTGRFVYVVNSCDNTVSLFTIDQTSGALTIGTTEATGSNPYAVTVDPTGRYAYVANLYSNDVSVFTIDPTSGALTSSATVAAGMYPISVSATMGNVAPVAPRLVTTGSGTESATLRWTYVASATKYNVYYGTAPGVGLTGTKISNAVNGAVITGLTNDTTYYFVVTAENSKGESVVSAEVSVTPHYYPAPAAPSGVTATAGIGSVTMTWDGVTDASSYNLYYSTSSGVTTANGIKVTDVVSGRSISGYTNGTTYYLIITAMSPGGEGPASGEVSATPQLPPVPAAPTGVSAIPDNSQVTLNWASISGATSYRIYYGTSSGVTTANGTRIDGAVSGNAIGLTNGTTYYFVVTAVNAGGESPVSTEVTATPHLPANTPKFAYVANSNSNTVSVYTVGSYDSLTAGTAVATGTTPRSVTVDPSGRFVYVANYGSYSVSVYTINQTTGALTTGTAVGTGLNPNSITVDPSGRFAYVANYGSNSVSVYTINQASGVLTLGTAVATSSAPYSVTVDPTGRFAYVANYGYNTVSAYSINQTSGALTAVGTAVATGSSPRSVTVDPSGQFAYVANGSSSTVSVYTINQNSGALSAGTAVTAGTTPYSIAINPSGTFAYVANYGSNNVYGYQINQTNGALTDGTVVATGSYPYSVTVDPSGRFAYVAYGGYNKVYVYSINQTSGALSLVSSKATGSTPMSVAVTAGVGVSAAPRYLTASAGNNQITLNWFPAPGATSYNVYYSTSAGSGTTGTKLSGVTSGSVITGLTNGTTYYVVVTAVNASGESTASNEVTATPFSSPPPPVPTALTATAGNGEILLTWTASTGAASYNLYYGTSSGVTTGNSTRISNATSGSTITGLTNNTTYYFVVTAVTAGNKSELSSEVSATPQQIAGSARFAYVANYGANTVSAYQVNQLSGALTAIGSPVATGSYPRSVTADPTGRFAYVANTSSNTVSVYQINQTTGALTVGTAVATGSSPYSVTVDPTGRFAYVTNWSSNTVSVYQINQANGGLTAGTAVSTGTYPSSVTVDPTGRFAYVANYYSNSVSVYSIDQTTGALTVGIPVATGSYPQAVTVDPTGRFAYVANSSSNTVSVYQINQTTGDLTAGTAVPTGSYPYSVTVDPTGRFAYVANSNSNTLSGYSINQISGALTSLGAAVASGSPHVITVDTLGHFVYVANYSNNTASLYSINQTSGALTAVGTPVATGTYPMSVTTTAGGYLLSPPASLSVNGGSGQAAVSWRPVYGASSYNVYYGTTHVLTLDSSKVSATTNSTTIAGLTPGVTYYFAVTALNLYGESVLSNPAAFSLNPVSDAALGAMIISNSITVTGLNAPTVITVSNGEYSIDGGSYTSVSGTVSNGQSVNLRLIAADGYSMTHAATVTIGATRSIFNVTTASKATATVNLESLNQTYDGTAKSATATTTPAGKIVNLTYDGGATAPTNVGTYAVIGTINDSKYQGAASGTLTIAKAPQSITFASLAAKSYGDAPITLGATGGASGNSITFTSSNPAVAIIDGVTVTIKSAGSTTITASQAGNSNYFSATAQQTLTINKATVTVTAENKEKTYNTANPGLTAIFSGFINGEDKTVLAGAPTISTTATISSNVGTYPITPAVGSLSSNNYRFSYVPGTLTIAKAPTTITWSNPADISYSTQLSATQLNATASVPGAIVYSPSLGTVLSTGTNQTLLASFTPDDQANYQPVSKDVSINVNQASQVITFNPLATKTYGDAPVTLTATGGASGNPGTFSIVSGSGSLSGTNNNTLSITGAGTIVISASQAGNANYTAATSINQNLIVNKAQLIVAANPVSREYNTANPTFSAGYSGFVKNETLSISGITGSPSMTTTAGTNSPVGQYAITASANSLTSNNYSFSFMDGTLNITKATASVSLSNLNQNYDGTAKTATVTTVPNGLNVAVTYNGSATGPTNAGSYAVVATINDNNYQGSASGTMSINAAPKNLTVTVLGTGVGTVTSSPAGISCTSGSCSSSFAGAVSLYATPSVLANFVGWGGGGCSGTGTCNVSMDAEKTVTATFNSAVLLHIGGTEYSSLQAAYDAASDGAIIQLLQNSVTSTLNANKPITIKLKGGYDSGYASNPGNTTVNAPVIIKQGKIVVDRIVVK
jgi:6-phosphogluconolactonase (cycloisomerase 2 family)/alpha-tubulin suppressor-like RCC1 family protein/fibronectin type 3 domain-containing protein